MLVPIELLGFALLPPLGVLIGSLLAESLRTPKWVVGAALHATAGVAIALVSVDIMPRLLAQSVMWLIILGFTSGKLGPLQRLQKYCCPTKLQLQRIRVFKI